MTCTEYREFFNLPMKEFDRLLNENTRHMRECEPCREWDRENERQAMGAVVAMVTNVPLDDWPSEMREEPEFRRAYRYMDAEELFHPEKEEN